MNVVFSVFLSDILPIFLIAGVGYLLAKKLQANVKTLAHVVFYALIPCFVFKMLIGSKVGGPEAGRMALLAILVAATMGVLARIVAIPLRLNRVRSQRLPARGDVFQWRQLRTAGGPVCIRRPGVAARDRLLRDQLHTDLHHRRVSGCSRAAKRFQGDRGIAKVPAMYGVAAAGLVLIGGVSVPLALMRPIQLMADAAIPS